MIPLKAMYMIQKQDQGERQHMAETMCFWSLCSHGAGSAGEESLWQDCGDRGLLSVLQTALPMST